MRGAWAVPALLALGFGACASAQNYLDPDEPRFETRYGTATEPSETIRVVSFNVKFAEKVDKAIAIFQDVSALREPDILALQEMDAEGTEWIARALEMNAVFFPSAVHPKTGRNFGNALLSPWPLEDARKFILPHESRFTGLKRAATVATVRIGEQRIRVYSVHIETPIHLSSSRRKEQVQAILDDAHASSDPVVVVGDFNSRGLHKPFEEAGYLWVTRNLRDTSGWWELDHIFVRGLRPPGPATAGVSEDLHDASDHRPVWALLEIE